MNDESILPILLPGGAGTRLWPESREAHPKQFLPLAGEQMLFQQTWARLDQLTDCNPPVVVGNEGHRFLVSEQLAALGVTQPRIVLEPCGRDTVPALATAAFEARSAGDDPLLLALPADHAISDIGLLHKAIRSAAILAAHEWFMTFGIVPTHAHTGTGCANVHVSAIDGVSTGREVPGGACVNRPSQHNSRGTSLYELVPDKRCAAGFSTHGQLRLTD